MQVSLCTLRSHYSLRCGVHLNFSVAHLHPVYILFKDRADSSDSSPLRFISHYWPGWCRRAPTRQTDCPSCSHPCKQLLSLHTERNDISSEPSHARCLCAHGAGHGDIFPLFLWDGVGFLQPQAERCWGGVWDRQAGGGIRFTTVCLRGAHTVNLCEVLGRYFVKTILCQSERHFTERTLGLLSRSESGPSWNVDVTPANTVLFFRFTPKRRGKMTHSKWLCWSGDYGADAGVCGADADDMHHRTAMSEDDSFRVFLTSISSWSSFSNKTSDVWRSTSICKAQQKTWNSLGHIVQQSWC